MNDIQMKDAKNMDGMIVPSSRCTIHRMASSRDYSSSSSSGGGTLSSIKRLHQ